MALVIRNWFQYSFARLDVLEVLCPHFKTFRGVLIQFIEIVISKFLK